MDFHSKEILRSFLDPSLFLQKFFLERGPEMLFTNSRQHPSPLSGSLKAPWPLQDAPTLPWHPISNVFRLFASGWLLSAAPVTRPMACILTPLFPPLRTVHPGDLPSFLQPRVGRPLPFDYVSVSTMAPDTPRFKPPALKSIGAFPLSVICLPLQRATPFVGETKRISFVWNFSYDSPTLSHEIRRPFFFQKKTAVLARSFVSGGRTAFPSRALFLYP